MENELSNNTMIETVSALLVKRRGYVYAIPHNEPVVLTMTGGLDSSIAARLIIEQWKVTVYPIYIIRGACAEKYEIEAVRRVHKYISQIYPERIKEIVFVTAEVPPKEIKRRLSRDRVVQHGHPLRNPILQSYAVQYAISLSDQGVPIRTVVVGSIASDHFPGSRPGDLIVNTLYVCTNLDEWQWQIVSPYFQPGLLKGKERMTKYDLIQWGITHSFPFEITRTCTADSAQACGICSACCERLEAFAENNVKDPLLDE
jgi:7-cyano-7-deazaguanine synthase in queuosine biosynthesis